jgi:predicted dehydrogenase
MLNRNKIRVGIVGANPSRGFASISHIPALQALADFEISAVCTTRQDSADAAARHPRPCENSDAASVDETFERLRGPKRNIAVSSIPSVTYSCFAKERP